MNITTIDYKKVKCPKCGKSYFRVKENNDFNVSFLVFTKKPDPIYRDGELQNPAEAEPIKVRCECLECGCNFRVETHDVFGDYQFIDEDEERKENERKLAESFKMLKNETEKVQAALVIETPFKTDNCQLKIAEPQLVSADIKLASDEFSKMWQNELRKELDEVKDRLSKLENETKERFSMLESK